MFSRSFLPHVVLGLLALLTAVSAPAADLPLAPAQEVHARGGLPNFFQKTNTPGAEIKIAYFGGSITAQNGWRPKTLAYFQQTYPGAKFTQINAAIGGTGSDLGVFRLQQDVLAQKPDLMFVEFATNDLGASPDQIFRCMEGIVRQTWRALPSCDICFVYTLTEAAAPAMLAGQFPRSASAMEKIAEHYGIPTIHMGMEVTRLAKEGKLLWRAPLPKTPEEKAALGEQVVFAPDSVHPHVETGHELYLQAIVRSLPSIQAAATKPTPHVLKKPFLANNYENARLVSLRPDIATLSPGFQRLDPETDPFAKRWSERLPVLYKAAQPGDILTFKFKGTRAALYDLVGPDCGQVIVTLDQQPPRIVPRFDMHSTYHRLATLVIGTDLPDTLHTVKIEIHPDQPDKVAILAKNQKTMDKPERFDGTAIYPGAILVLGEVVK